ncbi:MAG: FeoB-associated Cys-rich membrane protein [Gemmiger sp.]|nr:FeoB-associated Cys-rich membrane protein [Gemmiger sp.]
MNLQSILILLAIFIVLALAVVWIARNGGWQGGGCSGCGGNCGSCHAHCDEKEAPPQPPKKEP